MRWRGKDRCLDGRLCPRGRASERAPHGHRLPSPPCAVFGAAKSRSREAPCWCPSSRRPAACTRSADRRSEVRTGKEATGQRWRRVLGRLKWPLMAARPSPSLAPTSTPTSFRSRADDRCRQRAGERRRRRGRQWATAARRATRSAMITFFPPLFLSLSPTQSTSLFDPFQARYP